MNNNNNRYPGFRLSSEDGNISRLGSSRRYDDDIYSDGRRPAAGNSNPRAAVKKKKKAKNVVAVVACIAVMIASVAAVGGVYLWSQMQIEEDFSAKGWEGNEQYITHDKDIINVLICGIDIDDENPGRVRSNLTDTMMVASLNTETKQVSVLNIPRDTYVGTETYNGKINSIYSNQNTKSDYVGLNGLRKFLYEKYFISTDHYVTIQMDGFRKVVDSIGGVECDVPHTFTLDGMTIKKGLQLLNGKQAERFVRERKSFATGDFGRIESQQTFLKAFAKKVLGTGKIDLAKLVMENNSYLTSDMGSPDKLLAFAEKLKGVDVETMTFNVVPVNGAMVGTQSVQKIDAEKFAEIINLYFPNKDKDGNVTYIEPDMLTVK
jgi:cell envelope-related function transcriptional attenuator common domain